MTVIFVKWRTEHGTVFCRDKKDYCDILNCKSCEFVKGHGVIDGVYTNDVLTTLFGENYDLNR